MNAIRCAGFRHRDLRVTNVMEAITRAPLQTRSAGGGVHTLPRPIGEGLPAKSATDQSADGGSRHSPAQAASQPGPAQPLADMRFKIIDFGHANVRAFRR